MNISRTPCPPSLLRDRLGVAGLSLALFTASLFSQESPPEPVQTYPQYQSLPATQTLSPESLNQLLAPIALYPDALVALILPASTVPTDVVLASRYLAGNGDTRQIPAQSWDNSVQSLASYPDVVVWMDQNLEWTTSLGQAFLVQPADVMNAIQQLRAQAQAAGNLVNTPQQVIVKERTIIRIVPAEPDYLYVPQYDPEIVYVQPYSQDYGPLITFGIGFAVGSWLNYDFDWNRHQIYRGDWQPGWNYSNNQNGENNNGNRRANLVNIDQNTAQPWQAGPRSRQQLTQQQNSFQAPSNNFDNSRAASGVTVAPANSSAQTVRQMPRPSRANFGNRDGGNRNPEASARQPSASPARAVPGTRVIQTTTPPDVVGQQGRPRQNPGNANVGQSETKHGQKPPSTVRSPQNPLPAQAGNVPPGSHPKNQGAANPDNSARVPQTTRAPAVDQNGRAQSTASQPTPVGKHNQNTSASPHQAPPHAIQPQSSSAPTGTNPGHNNNNPDRRASPPAQTQPSQPAPRNTHERQIPPVQPNPPQQPSQAPTKHSSGGRTNNPAAPLQPQQQRNPQQQDSKHQAQNPAPAPASANPAANTAEAQPTPPTKKSEKKKDADKGH